MRNWINSSFKTQLIMTMVGILFIPILLGCIFTYKYFADRHKTQTANELKWLKNSRAALLEEFFSEQFSFFKILASDREVQNIFLQANNGNRVNLSKTQKSYLQNKFSHNTYWQQLNFYCITVSTEKIFYQQIVQSDFGKTLTEPPVLESHLQKVVKQSINSKMATLSDLEFYAPANSEVAFLAIPVFNLKKEVIGVLVGQFPSQKINAFLTDKSLRQSDFEIYLLNHSGRVIGSETRNESQALVNVRQFSNFTDCFKITDSNGQEAFACAQPLKFDSEIKTTSNWYVVTQIKHEKFVTPLHNLIIFFIILSVFLLLIGGLVAFWMGNKITKPIRKITQHLGDITKGDLSLEVDIIDQNNEIGILTRSLNSLMENLKNRIKDITENINIITSSTSEVSATVAQITAASTETASAITQTASSAEEVSQLATTFNEKSKESLKVGEQAARITNQGTQAFNQINQGIKEVKNQMDQVAAMVLELSKQSQTIGEITDVVKEIAEQSNILAINASIEATKAGEYGKGFAVVANEVRNLADQSKKSTMQIRDILDSIQDSISKTVMQVEQTNKTIDNSVDFVGSAYDSMNQLADSIEGLIAVLNEIAQFSHEQLAGTSQIKEAMENIKEATSQNLDGMHQLEEVIDDLKQTSQNLKDLIDLYKLV